MKFGSAIGLSVLLHLALAVGWGVYLAYAPGPMTLATLDVTSVELSFAEEEADVAPVSPMPTAPPPEPPVPDAVKLPEPELGGAASCRAISEQPRLARREAAPPMPEAVKLPEPDLGNATSRRVTREQTNLARQDATPPTPPPAAPRQAKVDAPPSPRKPIKPDYPRGARQRGEEGDVKLELRISARGVVEAVTVVTSSGYSELDEAAKRAVKTARFTPAKSGKKSVPTTAQMTLTFRLKK